MKARICEEEGISVFIDDREKYVLEVGLAWFLNLVVCRLVREVHSVWRLSLDLQGNQG